MYMMFFLLWEQKRKRVDRDQTTRGRA